MLAFTLLPPLPLECRRLWKGEVQGLRLPMTTHLRDVDGGFSETSGCFFMKN